MLVTNKGEASLKQYLDFIKICASSGITSLQLREKKAPYKDLLELGKRLKEILTPHNIPLIINDNIQLAIELNADGVHLGQSDGDHAMARKILGKDKIIGVSVNSFAEMQIANRLAIDYVGVGAIFPTTSKSDIATIWGINGLKQLSEIAEHPMIAIGGINETNASSVIAAGASGIAVINAIHNADNPELTIKNFLRIMESK